MYTDKIKKVGGDAAHNQLRNKSANEHSENVKKCCVSHISLRELKGGAKGIGRIADLSKLFEIKKILLHQDYPTISLNKVQISGVAPQTTKSHTPINNGGIKIS